MAHFFIFTSLAILIVVDWSSPHRENKKVTYDFLHTVEPKSLNISTLSNDSQKGVLLRWTLYPD